MSVLTTGRGLRRTSVLAGATLLTLLSSGAALAMWPGAGSGSGSASTATTSALALTPATPTDQLYPGGQASVVLTVTNPSAASVRFHSLVLDTDQGTDGFGVDGGHSGCDLSDLSFSTQTNGGAGWTVPGNSAIPLTLTDALTMGVGATNACQGAAFTVYLAVTP